jgi:hypothetical protein
MVVQRGHFSNGHARCYPLVFFGDDIEFVTEPTQMSRQVPLHPAHAPLLFFRPLFDCWYFFFLDFIGPFFFTFRDFDIIFFH